MHIIKLDINFMQLNLPLPLIKQVKKLHSLVLAFGHIFVIQSMIGPIYLVLNLKNGRI